MGRSNGDDKLANGMAQLWPRVADCSKSSRRAAAVAASAAVATNSAVVAFVVAELALQIFR